MSTTVRPRPTAEPPELGAGARPDIEIVVPVYNEERVLAQSIHRLHRFLDRRLPFSWQIVIADNASVDLTPALGRGLAHRLDHVTYVRLNQKGRGRALRAAWSRSQARVVAYMDVDLSTDLRALLTLTSAENAATAANAGSTANGASTETDSSLSGAAYEVHITKADGSKATVIEDSSFNVLATQADQGGGGCGHGGPGNGETALTGSTLTSAENAATAANAGSTATGASTETDSSLSGAAYEVHITKADGSKATVIEDSSFNVLATQADQGGGGRYGR
jgi:uncharacterized membrane protein YkoI